jgi:hypothetical protein
MRISYGQEQLLIQKADDNIELRREAMETFDVQVTLTVEDDRQVFYGSCMLQLEPERFDMDSGIVTIVPDILLSGATCYTEFITINPINLLEA